MVITVSAARLRLRVTFRAMSFATFMECHLVSRGAQ
jgi:hypothetical protein